LSNFIPDDKISDIRHAADIVDIISDAVLLKKSGKNFLGLCPFHSEKTPSFTVSPDKQMYYCFGCGAGGNVFTFLMEHDGLSFPECARRLADQYAIDLPGAELSPEEKERMDLRENLFAVNRQARDYFAGNLRSGPGRRALAYLKDRGVAEETIETFELGFAPEGWDRLLRHFAGERVDKNLLNTAGLIVPRKEGEGYYDRFRNRIIFPIADIRGQVTGFGGRVMDDGVPKYLNSPESPVYHKARSLYGLHRTRPRCRERGAVFLVEGYFDLLTLWQYGIGNCAATLGTSMTPDHVRMLKAVAREVVLVYDSDAAGVNAATRSVAIFDGENVDARIMVLPAGHDPDTFLRQEGADAFRSEAEKALGMIPFMMESAVRTHGLSLEGKARVISEMAGPVAAVTDSVKRALYVQALADRTGVDEDRILQKLRDADGSKTPAPRPAAPGPRRPETLEKGRRIEGKIVAMMLQHPDIIPEVRERRVLDRFQDDRLAAIGRSVMAHPDRIGSGLDLLLEDEEKRRMAAALTLTEEPWDEPGCRRLLDQFETGRARSEKTLIQQIKAAEQNKDTALLMELLKEKQQRARGAEGRP